MTITHIHAKEGDPKGERSAAIAEEKGILLMLCNQCVIQRELATGEAGGAEPNGTVDGITVGCLSDLYAAVALYTPDQAILSLN